MSVRRIGWMGMMLAMLASGGCCWFCERHCPQCAKAPAPVYAAPAPAPVGGCCCVPCTPAGYTPATTTTATPAWAPPASGAQCSCPAPHN
jgi:hypothetical protein